MLTIVDEIKGGGVEGWASSFSNELATLWELMLGHLGRKLPNRRGWESKDEESNCEREVL